jgi:hypothetical protein
MESVLPRSSIEPVGSSKHDYVSNVLSRLKSGPDYTRLPLSARENMKFEPGLIGMHDPFRCRRSPMTTLLWVKRGPVKVDSSVILYLR